MSGSWSVKAQISASRWFEVPGDLEDPQAWAGETARRLVPGWGPAARASGVDELASLLMETWAKRDPDAMVNLLFWPVAAPLVGRVSIAVRRFDGVRDWLDRGYVLDECSTENIGPGMKCVYMDADGPRARFVASAFVFKRDDHAVVVSTAPMLPLMYDAMTPDLLRTIDTIEAVDSNGKTFLSEPIREVATNPMDTWIGESVE